MKAEQIKQQLKSKNINYSVLADALDVSPSHVRNVAERIFISTKTAKAISIAIEQPFKVVFPDYISKKSRPKIKDRSKKITDLRKILAKQSQL